MSFCAVQGVGFIFSRPELVFRLAMDLGNSRPEWDLTFDYGSVIEQIDEQTDIIHVAFKQKVRVHFQAHGDIYSLEIFSRHSVSSPGSVFPT